MFIDYYVYCCFCYLLYLFFFSSRRRHTRCALVTGVQTCALPICAGGTERLPAVRLRTKPRMPLGMNRITSTRITPTAALPAIGLLPAVKKYIRQVMATAPTAGPAQWRVPPSTLISTTVSGTTMVKVSPAEIGRASCRERGCQYV